MPGLRDYVKNHYPLGPVWSATGKAVTAAPTKAPTQKAPAPPPPPPASLFASESSQASSSGPKQGMSAVFQEINSGKPVTAGRFPCESFFACGFVYLFAVEAYRPDCYLFFLYS